MRNEKEQSIEEPLVYVRGPEPSRVEITTELPVIKTTDELGNKLSPEEIQKLAIEAMERIEKSKTN